MPSVDFYEPRIRALEAARQRARDPDVVNRAARASLFFDDDAMIEYLASQRFPNDPSAALRYEFADGEIVYRDDQGNLVPEFDFGEDASLVSEYLVPNLAPAVTFAADLAGGMAGATRGFSTGVELARKIGVKNPWAISALTLGSAALGGAGGTAVAGGAARGGRELMIDQFYNLPPEEAAAAYRDLMVSAGFSAIPFGAGPTRAVVQKFSGKEDALRYLLNLRASTDEVIQEAQQKFGIQLTPAEASDVASKASNIQFFLSRQPQIEKLRRFYDNRASRIREAVEVFSDNIGSGMQRFGDINRVIRDTANDAMAELAKRRKTRAGRLYDSLRGEGGEELYQIDIKPIMQKVTERLKDPKIDPGMESALRSFQRLLVDRANRPITGLMALHDRRKASIQNLIKDNLGTEQGNVLIGLRDDMTALMDEAAPEYRLARRVYDPTKPNLQATERSAIGKLANLVTDKQTANALKELFNPNVSVQSIRNARRVLQAQDPQAWKDVKGMYIKTRLDDFWRASGEQGLPQFQQFFASPRTRAMMEEMLEPEEFQNFSRLIEIIGKAQSVQRSGSPTQQLLALEQRLAQEGKGLGASTLETLLAAIRLPGRLLSGQVGDDLVRNISLKQADAYMDKLTDVLLGENGEEVIDQAYRYFMPLEFGTKQAILRGGVEAEETLTEPRSRMYSPTEGQFQDIQQQERDLQLLEQLRQPQTMAPPAPMPPSFNPAMSPTILPNPEDRELAARLQGGILGLG